jgi:tetratricopeptide (TPR) repeat protein
MAERRDGRVVTFYSFTGGSGRTMALANTAWILAANGKRVLVVDWDLESPGLYRFFHPFLDGPALDTGGGVIDLVRQFELAAGDDQQRLAAAGDDEERPEAWYAGLADLSTCAFPLRWRHFPDGGGIDYVSAGRQDDAYASSLGAMDWDAFYTKGGGRFFDALRRHMAADYDYALIDSQTGLSDIAQICTTRLPDVVVDCFTLSDKGIEGAARAATAVRGMRRPVRVLPVPMRVDLTEPERVEAGRSAARQRFSGLPAGLSDEERDAYWRHVQVPYQSTYAYEEMLATFTDLPGQLGSLLASYEQLTWYLTEGEVRSLPALEESLRYRTAGRFFRRTSAREGRVLLRYEREDLVWAEWITEILTSVGVIVHDGSAQNTATARELLIISTGRSAREAARRPTDPSTARAPLGVYVDDVYPVPAFAERNSAVLHGCTEEDAVDRLLRLVGHTETAQAGGALRYPGLPPAVFNVPPRGRHFTGREGILAALHQRLRPADEAAPRQCTPVALQGLGGVGKTQLAIEHAHRLKGAYDVVWWIACDQETSVETGILELGAALGITWSATGPDGSRAVLGALRRGEPHRHWLIVFDDAAGYDQVSPFLPQGAGEVIITSRNQSWGDRVVPMPVDVFERPESVAHLRKRVDGLRKGDAASVAEVLGDLPIAVAAAGTWLVGTGTPVADFLRRVERDGPSMLAVEAIWDLSLKRLRQQSIGAYRLLQLFSVLAPKIALALIYSDEMASALRPYDRSVADRYVRGSLVQEINRLALLKLDLAGGQIHVHRLLQRVVRERMTPEELREARHQVHLVLSRLSVNQDVDDPETWPRFRMLWPHLAVSQATTCRDREVRQLMIDRVRHFWLRGALEPGEALAREIETAWIGLAADWPDDDEGLELRRQIQYLRCNLANIVRDLGRFEAAHEIDLRVREAQTAPHADDHPLTLMNRNGIAADLRALGRYAEALDQDKATYDAWVERFGPVHSLTLNALNNLATSYRLAGDYKTALERDNEVYRLRRAIAENQRHPAVLHSASNVGRGLRDTGEYQQSAALLRDVARAYAETFGRGSRAAVSAATNLAVSLREAGRADEAAPLLEAAYERFNDSAGPANPHTLACRHSWALNLLATHRVEKAWAELQAIRDAYQQRLGARHPHTVVTVANLAMVARADGDPVLAQTLARSAAADLGAVLGARHPFALAAEMNLAVLVAEQGDRERAGERLRDVVAGLRHVLGPEHPDTLRAEANNALMTGEETEPVLGRFAARIGVAHPTVAALRDRRPLHRLLDPHPY